MYSLEVTLVALTIGKKTPFTQWQRYVSVSSKKILEVMENLVACRWLSFVFLRSKGSRLIFYLPKLSLRNQCSCSS